MKKTKKLSANLGFTLIELLIAMTVVAVLLGVALVSFKGARVVARDGQRKTELEEIRSALEVFRTDNGDYPTTAEGLSTLLTGGYFDEVPSDPLSPEYDYLYTSDSVIYHLCARLESRSTGVNDCGVGAMCGSEGNCNYAVANP